MKTPIKVSVIYPGYIRSEMNERVKNAPFIVSTEKGVAAIVDAIEKEKAHARVPAWPWVPMGFAMKHAPLPLARKLMG
jgi:short-subunit dehydrogenase